jgi:hypothetical protein
MTPETKLHMPFRPRRTAPAGDPLGPSVSDGPTQDPGSAGAREDLGDVDPGNVRPGNGDPDDTAPGNPELEPGYAEGEPTFSRHVTGAMSDTAERLRESYRNPVAPVSSRRLALVSIWALLLVVGGAVVYLRALLVALAGSGTGLAGSLLNWVSFGGLLGLGLTIAAFLTIGRRQTPWVVLGLATAVLFTLLVLTAIA